VKRRLTVIREIAQSVFAGSDERIYYGVPTLRLNGKDILNYAAYKDHINLFIGYEWSDFLKTQYPQFSYIKSAVQIPHEMPFPEEFVKEVCGLLSGGI